SADAKELRACQRLARVDPAIIRLGVIRSDSQQYELVWPRGNRVEGEFGMTHEERVVAHVMVARENGNDCARKALGQSQKRVQNCRCGSAVFRLDDHVWCATVSQQRPIETFVRPRDDNQRACQSTASAT